ncbi:MAG TPA: hypothetical protein PKG84_11720 [Novosphingobium sp.]|nr:hypothetical protein [Novosphingobium sp.]
MPRPALATIILGICLAGCAQSVGYRAGMAAADGSEPWIPPRYQGLWADRLANCLRAGDHGVQMQISERLVDAARVLRAVEIRSDTKLVIDLEPTDPGQDHLILRIAENGQRLDATFAQGRSHVRLLRCPQPDGGASQSPSDE